VIPMTARRTLLKVLDATPPARRLQPFKFSPGFPATRRYRLSLPHLNELLLDGLVMVPDAAPVDNKFSLAPYALGACCSAGPPQMPADCAGSAVSLCDVAESIWFSCCRTPFPPQVIPAFAGLRSAPPRSSSIFGFPHTSLQPVPLLTLLKSCKW